MEQVLGFSKSGIGANATATPTSTMVSPQFSIFSQI
jgi:hypothetical protein